MNYWIFFVMAISSVNLLYGYNFLQSGSVNIMFTFYAAFQIVITIAIVYITNRLRKKTEVNIADINNFMLNSKGFFHVTLNKQGEYKHFNNLFKNTFKDRVNIGANFASSVAESSLPVLLEKGNWSAQNLNKTTSLNIDKKLPSGSKLTTYWEIMSTLQNNEFVCHAIGLNIEENKGVSLEERIRKSADLVDLLTDSNEYFFWVYCANRQKRIFASRGCLAIYGYTPDEMTDENNLFHKIIQPSDLDSFLTDVKDASATGQLNGQYRVFHKNGSKKTVLIKANKYIDPYSEEELFIGYTYDITKTIQQQKQIKAANKRINEIINTINEPMLSIDANNEIVFVNKAFAGVFPKVHDPDISCINLVDFELQSGFKGLRENIITARRDFLEQVHVFELQRGQETYRLIVYAGFKLTNIIIRNITHELAAEFERNKSQQILNNLMSTTKDLIWTVNNNYELIYFNEIFRSEYQLLMNEEPKIGMKCTFEKLGLKQEEFWKAHIVRSLNGEQHSIEGKNIYDKKIKYYINNFIPLVINNKIIGVSCISKDITERKIYELKIENQNKRFREISWMQSHEVRKPLANIIGLTSLFNTNDLTDPFNQTVITNLNTLALELDEYVHKVVNKANEVINELDEDEKE